QRGPDAASAAVRRRLPPGLGTGLVSRTCRRAQRQRGGNDRPGRALPPPPARRSAPPRVGGTSRQRGPSRSMTRLSVNVNKVAVLRNSRGGRDPDVLAAARACLAAGAHGITVHPRPDRRHIVAEDLAPLAAATAGYGVEFNIEGNPFAPPREGYPGLLALCEQVRPQQVTLVPDSDGQLTSDHGFDLLGDLAGLAEQVAGFTALGCRVSLFVDAGNPRIERVAEVGAQRIEIYTGPYAEAHAAGDPSAALAACA